MRRGKDAERKRVERRQAAEARVQESLATNASGYVVPPMPLGMSKLRRWYRDQQAARSRRDISLAELTECRLSFNAMNDSYKCSAVLHTSRAAMISAQAQERMAALQVVDGRGLREVLADSVPELDRRQQRALQRQESPPSPSIPTPTGQTFAESSSRE